MRSRFFRPARMKHLAGVLALSWGALAGLAAAEFTLESRAVSIPENGFFTSLIVHAARCDISLLPPPLWKLAIDTNTSSLVWKSPDFRTIIRLRLIDKTPQATGVIKESLRERIRNDFPDATIRDEFECYTSSHPGLAIEFEKQKTQFPSLTRLAIIPHAAGALEVEFTGPVEDYERTRHQMAWVMNSLRILPR